MNKMEAQPPLLMNLLPKGKATGSCPNDELVMVKGKGEMQTYFVTVPISDPSLYEKSTCNDAIMMLSSNTDNEGEKMPDILCFI